MFGGDLIPPKAPRPRRKLKPDELDIMMPSFKPADWAHRGRPPNTDYDGKLLHYKQRKWAAEELYAAQLAEKTKADKISVKFDKHVVKRRFQGEIKKRIDERMMEYDQTIQIRREKLAELLAQEERDYIWETIDVAQHGGDSRSSEMKERAQMINAKREAERLELVKEKRKQQYMLRCDELRTALAKKNIQETKNGQLQQMRENEARREAEREIDRMWYDVMMKEVRCKMEREEYDVLDRLNRNKAQTDVLDMQVKGKQLLEAEIKRNSEEDRIESNKLRDQLKQEEREAWLAKVEKRERTTREIEEQMASQQRFQAQRKKEEVALEEAFTRLAEIELERENAKIKDTTTVAKKEMAQYRRNLVELEAQRVEEERQLNELIAGLQKEAQRKADEASCKVLDAKRQLHKEVIEGRAEQIELRKREALEREMLKKEEENIMDLMFDTNQKLSIETERLKAEAAKKYRLDLEKQIEYNHLLKERERLELERQLALAKQEEEKYIMMAEEMVKKQLQGGVKHPFRRVLDRYDCHCPTTIVQPKY